MKWKKFGDYEVSDSGVVRKNMKLIKQRKIKNKWYFSASFDGKQRGYRVADVVAKLFIKNPKGSSKVGFKNGNTLDNRATNLFWKNEVKKDINYFTEHPVTKGRFGDICNMNSWEKSDFFQVFSGERKGTCRLYYYIHKSLLYVDKLA